MKKDNLNNSEDQEQRSQLLSFLNEEISQIQKDEARPGWTVWALFGSTAACFWILINHIENQSPDWNTISIMLITFAFSSFALGNLLKQFTKNESLSRQNRFVSIKSIFERSKQSTGLVLVYVFFIFILLNRTTYTIKPWEKNVTFLSINCLVFVIILAILFTKTNDFFILPYDIRARKISNKKLSFFICFILITFKALQIASAFVWINYILSKNLFNLYEFKICLLIFAIAILLILITSLKMPLNITNNLIELRRELVLDVLPTENIKNQIDLILRGQKIEDYYTEETYQILNSLQQFEKELFLASQKVNLFYNENITKNNIDEPSFIQDPLIQLIMEHLINAAEIMFLNIELAEKKLTRKTLIIKMFNKDLADEKLNKISTSISLSATNYNNLVKNWYETLTKIHNHEFSKNMILELTTKVPKLKFDKETGNIIS